ncbi:hypothetical protein BRARA_K00915 [Brassica rapa]|uniref:Terpene synthase N-terminal domain-containing protein n=1 Tax=Brassica campestris TaxID=3711 RepID=A0A397KWQ4_BRACM|nr:hypothetical protein BRARA_K00915 [Brassica rapa]
MENFYPDFPVNIWEDILTWFSNSDLASDTLKEKHGTLKETVMESFIASRENPIENIKFIDTLCRLGGQLEKSFDSLDFNQKIRQDGCDFYTVFQVFRLFGFKLSAGRKKKNKFKDEDGKFKAHLAADARGPLSLYEAAQWTLISQYANAQKHPFHKGISRIETRQYISYYEAEEKCDETLLEYAKIDFSLLQMLHRQELSCVTSFRINQFDEKSFNHFLYTYSCHSVSV